MKIVRESIITEEAYPKDEKRINDLIAKANGDEEKQKQLAQNMADKITGEDKATKRYEAAKKILGYTHPVTIIFAKRAKQLGNFRIEVPKQEPKQQEEKKEFEFDKSKLNDLWDRFLEEEVVKLRGSNWGQRLMRRLPKLFSDEELVHLAIKGINEQNSGRPLSDRVVKGKRLRKLAPATRSLIELVNKYCVNKKLV